MTEHAIKDGQSALEDTEYIVLLLRSAESDENILETQ
jgi:hypothetical protein